VVRWCAGAVVWPVWVFHVHVAVVGGTMPACA
jgi:hypothetical protein